MRTWLVRGVVLAVVHAIAAVVVAALRAGDPTGQAGVEALVLGVLVGVAAVWAAVDAWRGVADRARAWVLTALIAGWGAGVLSVIGRAVFVDQTGTSALGQALTGGAAFTALLVLVPAGLGLLVGTRLESRSAVPAEPEQSTADETAPSPRVRRSPLITPAPAVRRHRTGLTPRPRPTPRDD
ncbi:B-4DMT family transporter [Actinokineospora sp.]|uniref:B-4DMT family transporter n=1 Tax=Actinokineospora sp. TaxID=1872133 RepID=UPI004037F7DC